MPPPPLQGSDRLSSPFPPRIGSAPSFSLRPSGSPSSSPPSRLVRRPGATWSRRRGLGSWEYERVDALYSDGRSRPGEAVRDCAAGTSSPRTWNASTRSTADWLKNLPACTATPQAATAFHARETVKEIVPGREGLEFASPGRGVVHRAWHQRARIVLVRVQAGPERDRARPPFAGQANVLGDARGAR